jgi:cytochrome oxidase Cu insertion factor (SCO1/SenC/PrrC family)
MKLLFVVFTLALIAASKINAQMLNDTLPPYKKVNTLPPFKILQGDSTWFTNQDLPKNTPVVLIYFSPECGHCQLTTKDLVKNMSQLKDVFFLFVSYHAPQELTKFAKEYGLNHLGNVKLGRDPAYAIPTFYRVKVTPFMAAYNDRGKLLASWEQGTNAATIIKLFERTSN